MEVSMRKKPVRKVKSKLLGQLFSLTLIFAASFFFYQAIREIQLTVQLSTKISDSQQQIKLLEAQNQELTDQKAKLQDPEYVKSYARGAYMLSKDGEQIFQLQSPTKK
jgi:cell division protein DivIC